MDLTPFSVTLQYEFKNRELIDEALCHSSYVNEQLSDNLQNYERLEFLGDAVLNLAVGHILMHHYPEMREGDLSRMRATLVNETQLADLARSIHIGRYIKLGKGEQQSGGHQKNSILADAFEAVVAAVYLDGGFDAAYRVVETHFGPLLHRIETSTAHQDFKSQLQEVVQTKYRQTPVYNVISDSGPDHDKTFSVQLELENLITEGTGKSKKLAEQDAARKALDRLRGEEA